MSSLPPEDQPDEIEIGGVRIPIQYEDDPRFEAERALWHEATAIAQAAHSADELLEAIAHPEWRVRFEAIPRVCARWPDDPRTLPALIRLVESDVESDVREAALLHLVDFGYEAIAEVVARAFTDESEDVRATAAYVLAQVAPED